MELGQAGHVLHALDAAGVHGVHALPGHLRLRQVQHLHTSGEREFYYHTDIAQYTDGWTDRHTDVQECRVMDRRAGWLTDRLFNNMHVAGFVLPHAT